MQGRNLLGRIVKVEVEAARLQYKDRKKVLQKAIKKSKNSKWNDLYQELNQNPRWDAYEMITKELG